MQHAVLCQAVRTPIGRFQGGLSGVRPDDLAAIALGAALARSSVDGAAIDEVVLGCANQAGEDNRNVARMALLLAGLPDTVPGFTVNRLCASGLEAIASAARLVRCGDARLVLAGGVESMSRAPYSVPRGPQHPKAGNLVQWDTSLGWRYPNPAMERIFPLESMGETAENVADDLGISRADQDAFAVRSHQRAVAAQDAGAFAAELTPVVTGSGRSKIEVTADEGPRRDTTPDALARLAPAFRPGGTVTAGNSSTLNDGAAAVLVASEEAARAHGLTILARVRATASAGTDPRRMGLGPVPATTKALAAAGLTVGDIDLWELNEAFAAQALGVIRSFGLDEDRVNVHGGAIALGHPLGCSGARIVTTLLHAMARRGATVGAASLCVGVGQGATIIVEAV
jgi:3-oxoadipyl-CoA thiolase